MTIAYGWALMNSGKIVGWSSSDRLKVFATKKEAKRHKYIGGDRVVRVRIEEIPSECRSGCAMIDDVPVFCRRHSPQLESQEKRVAE